MDETKPFLRTWHNRHKTKLEEHATAGGRKNAP